MNKKLKWRCIFWICGIVVMLFSLWPLDQKIRQGLDLRGGMYLVIEVDKTNLTEENSKDAIDRVLEVIRNRIDQFGVEEPSILRQGTDRIVIQLPQIDEEGIKRAMSIIQTTAFLEFRLVNDDPKLLEEAARGRIPLNYELLPLMEKGTNRESADGLLVRKRPVLTGEDLVDATVEFNQGSFNEVAIGFELNRRGGKKFAVSTRENVGTRLAIVLDGKIVSAPVIREEIPGGRGQISGDFTIDEAKDLAIALRAGALPAPITVVESRTVGATLGKDSIQKGLRSGLIGMLLVVIFIAVYYRLSGLIAILALSVNIIIVFGTLAMIGAVLTLPGIAGIILTIGMAVDANVLIFERIREELRSHKSVRVAIQTGYDKALVTILDANVTTLIASGILYHFGSGPIRGFAITLSIGIAASMLTAIYGTKVIFDLVIMKKPNLQKLSI
ncbi:protein translocase subunit SecD [PVC group bacterium]|nr:protein translocase subunit SecD [PVC group bacterium]